MPRKRLKQSPRSPKSMRTRAVSARKGARVESRLRTPAAGRDAKTASTRVVSRPARARLSSASTKKARQRGAGSARPAPPAPAGIPEKQWMLPAGFLARSGRAASLKRVLDPKCHTVDVHALDDDQRCALTLKRIAKQRTFEFRTLDGQTLSKRRALAEVRKQTPLGRTLIDIEHRTIALMCEWCRCQSSSNDAGDPGVRGIAAPTPVDPFKQHVAMPVPGSPAALAVARRESHRTTSTSSRTTVRRSRQKSPRTSR